MESKGSFFLNRKEGDLRKAKAPRPKCNSSNTFVENGIFVCANCGFVEGDKI